MQDRAPVIAVSAYSFPSVSANPEKGITAAVPEIDLHIARIHSIALMI